MPACPVLRMIGLRGRVSIAGGCRSIVRCHPAGTRCATGGIRAQRPLLREEYKPVATDELHTGRWDVLGRLGEEVQGGEEVQFADDA